MQKCKSTLFHFIIPSLSHEVFSPLGKGHSTSNERNTYDYPLQLCLWLNMLSSSRPLPLPPSSPPPPSNYYAINNIDANLLPYIEYFLGKPK